jgi:hypothetical protein
MVPLRKELATPHACVCGTACHVFAPSSVSNTPEGVPASTCSPASSTMKRPYSRVSATPLFTLDQWRPPSTVLSTPLLAALLLPPMYITFGNLNGETAGAIVPASPS